MSVAINPGNGLNHEYFVDEAIVEGHTPINFIVTDDELHLHKGQPVFIGQYPGVFLLK